MPVAEWITGHLPPTGRLLQQRRPVRTDTGWLLADAAQACARSDYRLTDHLG